ncbi:MAG: AAA family ATPase [Bacteroidetes bacterium]|nr:AAA family ATPase [Bacteroidota bacterium]
MKISIKNFKSISTLNEYEIKPMTILSGVNSTGKSSFIQLLLLLKQTIELNSPNFQLLLQGPLYEVQDFADIIKNKDPKRKLSVGFHFEKSEFKDNPERVILFDSLTGYKSSMQFSYSQHNNEPFIDELSIRYLLDEGSKKEQFANFFQIKNGKDTFRIEANSALFAKNIWDAKSPNVTKIDFSAIYPVSYEISEAKSGTGAKGETLVNDTKDRQFTTIESVRFQVDNFFKNISYIGPLREKPKDIYSIPGRHENVGSNGEFFAEILERHKDQPIDFYKPEFTETGIKYTKVKTTLLKAVSNWMCDVMELGKEIRPEKVDDNYTIVIIQNSGISTTIKHVGFGISQLLPIIVEGLRLQPGATMVLEQPEIHLHPKLQSLLFDFLRSLMLNGVSIIIETHSDHYITRLRRRLAEDLDNSLTDKINLTFIETVQNDILFRSIELDDFGTMEYFPPNFIEQSSIEMKAIIKAQLRKKTKQSK